VLSPRQLFKRLSGRLTALFGRGLVLSMSSIMLGGVLLMLLGLWLTNSAAHHPDHYQRSAGQRVPENGSALPANPGARGGEGEDSAFRWLAG
jgi:hypothetical protein